jgi:hypothetical protein
MIVITHLVPSSNPLFIRAGGALPFLPLKRPHPTFVETTLPQRGRLVKAPALVSMHLKYRFALVDYKRALKLALEHGGRISTTNHLPAQIPPPGS